MDSVQVVLDAVQFLAVPPTRTPTRTRGQRAGLSRAQVLAAALAVLRRDGLDAVSMRRVAAELEVAPNALYSHLRDKAAVLDGLLDAILGEVELPDGGGWRAQIEAILADARRVLLAHPDLVAHLLARQTTGSPNALRLGEAVLTQLARGGIHGERAVRALQVLLVHTIGGAAFEVPRRQAGGAAAEGEPKARVARAEADVAKLDAAAFPHTTALAAELARHPGDAVFATGLRWILDGLEAETGAGPGAD